MFTKNVRLIRGGENGGTGVWRWGEREIIYLSLHRHHQNDSCIEMDSDESQFNVSLIVRDKVTRQCPQTTTFEEKGKLKWNRTEVLLITSLMTYCWAKPAHIRCWLWLPLYFIFCLFKLLKKKVSVYWYISFSSPVAVVCCCTWSKTGLVSQKSVVT